MARRTLHWLVYVCLCECGAQTLDVRFGVTLVGPAATGKSSTWRVLSAARSQVASATGGPTVALTVLNPKCISMEVTPRTCRMAWRASALLFILRQVFGVWGVGLGRGITAAKCLRCRWWYLGRS